MIVFPTSSLREAKRRSNPVVTHIDANILDCRASCDARNDAEGLT